MKKLKINMLSRGQDVKGQGVGSAFYELVDLLKEYAGETLDITVNESGDRDIDHYHTIDPGNYLRLKVDNKITVMYCHFLPETLEGSISLPKPAFDIFAMYFLDFYKSADYLVVVNPIFIDELVKYDIPRNNIVYIPNYVSKKDFYVQSDEIKLATRKKYGVAEDAFVVLGVGQVQTRKGVVSFVEVAKRSPEMTFVWAGGFSFGAITDGYQELKAIVENPPSNVIFTDIVPREEMNSIFNMADVLFMPSYNELFPMAILEAVNTETPLLLRNLELYEDILFNYLSGDNDDDFVYFLNKLKNSDKFYEQVTNYSIEISKFYSKEHVGQQWIDFYQRIYQEQMNHEISMFWETKYFEKLRSGKARAIVDGSQSAKAPLGNITPGDKLLVTSFNNRKLKATVKEVFYHENTDDEAHLDFLLNYQGILKLDASQIKKYANRTYLQIVEISEIEDLSI